MTNPKESPVEESPFEFELVLPEADEKADSSDLRGGERQHGRAGFWSRLTSQWLLGRRLTQLDEWPVRAKEAAEPETVQRLHHAIRWYHLASLQATRWYTTLKVVQIVAAASVPVLVATSGDSFANKGLIAGLGGLVVILEGVQQLKQYGRNAVKWAQASEVLKSQYFLFAARVKPYDGLEKDRLKVLAVRVEGVIGRDVAAWAAQPPEDAGEDGSSLHASAKNEREVSHSGL